MKKEHRWLQRIAPHLPLAIPVPLAKGGPSTAGSKARTQPSSASPIRCRAATELAHFIAALQRIDPAGGPLAVEHNLRGVPLALRDTYTREAIAALHGRIDVDAVTTVWEAALRAPEWDRTPVWFHGDLLPGNVLVEGLLEGRRRLQRSGRGGPRLRLDDRVEPVLR